MIEVEGLSKSYGDFTAVSELSFVVRPGEVMGLVGPNGAGKTTTLRCLAGIIPPTRGTWCGFAGINSKKKDGSSEVIAAKKELSFFTDEPRLFDYLTVEQHLTFTARIYQVADYERVGTALLEELEIGDGQGAGQAARASSRAG